jgi:hypothetical protein
MPTGTSTIFGAFQAIPSLLLERDDFSPSQVNYCASESSPAKYFDRLAQVFFVHRKIFL